MVHITLPDGSVRPFDGPVTVDAASVTVVPVSAGMSAPASMGSVPTSGSAPTQANTTSARDVAENASRIRKVVR